MSQEDKQSLTVQYMYGNWICDKGGEIPQRIILQKFPNKVKLVWENKIEEFDGNAHWFGEKHLCFLGPYYIRVPENKFEPDELIFGKFETESVVGKPLWEEKFLRKINE